VFTFGVSATYLLLRLLCTALNQDSLVIGRSAAHRPQKAAACLGAMSDPEMEKKLGILDFLSILGFLKVF